MKIFSSKAENSYLTQEMKLKQNYRNLPIQYLYMKSSSVSFPRILNPNQHVESVGMGISSAVTFSVPSVEKHRGYVRRVTLEEAQSLVNLEKSADLERASKNG